MATNQRMPLASTLRIVVARQVMGASQLCRLLPSVQKKMSRRNVDPAENNVRTVSRLEYEALRTRSLAERISDALTKAIGSITSITLHAMWFAVWITINSGFVPPIAPFDPFPFGVLTLIVSTEGVLLAIIILISQNRMIRQADRRAHLDLQISLLAEQETTLVLHTLQRIARKIGLPEDASEAEATKLIHQTDIAAMMRSLEEELPKE
jgi:uncharacterized membrane protein